MNDSAPEFVLDVHAAIKMTLSSLDAGFAAQKVFPTRIFSVVYEELVAEPKRVVMKLCEFWVDPNLGLRSIETSRIDVWHKLLNPEQLELVNAAFRKHDALRSLGYRFD